MKLAKGNADAMALPPRGRERGPGKALRAAAVAVLCVAAAARAQTAALDSWRAAVAARWEFQQRFPLAKKLFEGRADEAERRDLIGRLRQSAAAQGSGTQSVWAGFALGLAQERQRPGSGEAELAAAQRAASGDPGLDYEAARILSGLGLHQRVRAWQAEAHRGMLERGAVRLPELAKAELWRAGEDMRAGRFQSAAQSLEFARRLDPMNPWIPLQRLTLHARERSVLGWDLGYIWAALSETARLLRYYDAQSVFLVNLSRCLRFGLGLFGALGLLVLFARHFSRLAHPWAERLPQAVELRVRYLAIALGLLGLAVGGLGYAWLGVLGAMLLWRHCSRDEKAVLRGVLLGIALVPLLIAWERAMCRHLDARQGVSLYHQAWSKGSDPALIRRALDFAPRNREDSLYRALALSIQYKKQGNYLRAGEFAREASRIEPEGDLPLLNAGGLSLAAFEYARAADAFAAARRRVPERVETWFNSSQAELYTNHSAEHKKYLDRAAEADAAWVTQWLKDNDEHFPNAPAARKAMDPMLRAVQAWQGAWRSMLNLDFLKVEVRSGILKMPGSWQLAAVILAAAALWLRFRRYSTFTHGRDLFECRICGRIMCRACRKGVHCQNCFKTVSGVQENRVRVELVGRLRQRAALRSVRTGSILNSLFPGAGQLYLGKGGARFLWPLAVSLLFGTLWGMNHLVMEYPDFVAGPWRWMPLLPLALAYGVFNLKQLRKPVTAADVVSAQTALEKEAAR